MWLNALVATGCRQCLVEMNKSCSDKHFGTACLRSFFGKDIGQMKKFYDSIEMISGLYMNLSGNLY